MILILSAVLFLLLIIIGKDRGFKTFILFYLSFLLIILYIILISYNLNAILLAVIICIITSLLLLFGLNGYNIKTKSSFLAVITILLFVFILIYMIGKNANIQGFSAESIESIGGFSFYINYSMTDLMIGIYLITIIGTVIDTSISVSSALNEVYQNNPHLNVKELYKSGMNIGRDILSTTVNTLYFAVISTIIYSCITTVFVSTT